MKILVIKKILLTCLHSRMTFYTRVYSLFLTFSIPIKFHNTLEFYFFNPFFMLLKGLTTQSRQNTKENDAILFGTRFLTLKYRNILHEYIIWLSFFLEQNTKCYNTSSIFFLFFSLFCMLCFFLFFFRNEMKMDTKFQNKITSKTTEYITWLLGTKLWYQMMWTRLGIIPRIHNKE